MLFFSDGNKGHYLYPPHIEEGESVYFRKTQNISDLQHIKNLISFGNSNYSEYQPIQAIVVTWNSAVSFKLYYVGWGLGIGIIIKLSQYEGQVEGGGGE